MNPTVATLLEILKYILPALIVLISSYLIVKKFLVSELQRKQIALLRESSNVTYRLRLQAYERLTLFLERIHPRNLPGRVYMSGMTVREFQAGLVMTIQSEWEHNLSQQIYVSRQVWETVRGVKEQEINMINQLASQLSPDNPASELHKRVVEAVLTEQEELPTEMALHVIHDEARHLLAINL